MKNLPKRIKYKGQIYEAKTSNDWRVIEIKLIPQFDNTTGDYMYTEVVLSHDNGEDPKNLGQFEYISELSKFDFADIIENYENKVL